VTGVQTCALPISTPPYADQTDAHGLPERSRKRSANDMVRAIGPP